MVRASRLVTIVFAATLRATMGQGLVIDGWFWPSNRYREKYGWKGIKFYPQRW